MIASLVPVIVKFPHITRLVAGLFTVIFSVFIFLLQTCVGANTAQASATSPPIRIFTRCEFSGGGSLFPFLGQSLFLEAYTCKGTRHIAEYDPNTSTKPVAKPEPIHLRSVYLLDKDAWKRRITQTLYGPDYTSEITIKNKAGVVCASIKAVPQGEAKSLPIPFDYLPMTSGKEWQSMLDYLVDDDCNDLGVFLGIKMAVIHKPGKYSFKFYRVRFDVTKLDVSASSEADSTTKLSTEDRATPVFFAHCGSTDESQLNAYGKRFSIPYFICHQTNSVSSTDSVKDDVKLYPTVSQDHWKSRVLFKEYDGMGQSIVLMNKDGAPCFRIRTEATKEPMPMPDYPDNTEWQRTIWYMADDQCNFAVVAAGERLALIRNNRDYDFFLHRLHVQFTTLKHHASY